MKGQTWPWAATELPWRPKCSAEGHFWKPVPQFGKELEAGKGKQGLCDAESELGQGHIKNQGMDAKGGMDVTGEKEGKKCMEKKHC